jgi:putative tricarboxylic transport membrane protein
MEILNNVLYGFSVAFTAANLFYCFLGVLLGTLIGVLPGLGPIPTISILLPITLYLPPISAIIMLAGIFYGAQYGGSTTSILVNIPGEVSSVVTCIDGYQMALKGRAGPAIGLSAIGSFIGATISIMGIVILAVPLANMALKFGPPEYFALIVLAITILTGLAVEHGTIKALLMAVSGMLLGTVGIDTMTGIPRFTGGIRTLYDGVGIVAVVMGLFGVGEVLINIEEKIELHALKTKIDRIFPSVQDWIKSRWAILRGALIGFTLGILPGAGPIMSTFSSYSVEKKLSRHPEEFGHGAIEGVVGPETANNSAAQSSFIPLLTLGIPPNLTMALLLGALMIHGIQPGPLLIVQHPDLFWGVICSMYIGNFILLILNLPLVGLWVQVLRIPYTILFPLIVLLCFTGVYSVKFNVDEIYIMVLFGLAGYLMKKFRYERAPLVIGMVLGPIMEDAFRQSLTLSDGSMSIFFTRPISAVLMIFAILVLVVQVIPWNFRGTK